MRRHITFDNDKYLAVVSSHGWYEVYTRKGETDRYVRDDRKGGITDEFGSIYNVMEDDLVIEFEKDELAAILQRHIHLSFGERCDRLIEHRRKFATETFHFVIPTDDQLLVLDEWKDLWAEFYRIDDEETVFYDIKDSDIERAVTPFMMREPKWDNWTDPYESDEVGLERWEADFFQVNDASLSCFFVNGETVVYWADSHFGDFAAEWDFWGDPYVDDEACWDWWFTDDFEVWPEPILTAKEIAAANMIVAPFEDVEACLN